MPDKTTKKSSPPEKPSPVALAGGGILAIAMSATLAVSSFTGGHEAEKFKSYLDAAGIPTICRGHTLNVKLGQTATKDQCDKFYIDDMKPHMIAALTVSPRLKENSNALKAVGDLTFNAGDKAYVNSPMKPYFDKGDWVNGCNHFVGYYVGATYSKPQPKLQCHPHAGKPGKYLCVLNGLVKRRINEKTLCLTGKMPVL